MFGKIALPVFVLLAAFGTGSSQATAADADQIIISNVAIGAIDPNAKVPAINAISGSGVTTWAIATPIAQLSAGQNYMFTTAFQDISYTGSCTLSAKFSQIQNGKKVALKGIHFFPATCEAGKTYLVNANTGRMPNAPGPVTLTVTVSYGAQKSTVKVPLVLQ